jgi:hypothetical protein
MFRRRELFEGTIQERSLCGDEWLRDGNEIDLPALLTAIGNDCLVD